MTRKAEVKILPGKGTARVGKLRSGAAVALLVSQLVFVAGPAANAASPAAIQRQLDETAAAYSRLETQLADTQSRRARLESDLREAGRIIDHQANAVRKRAGYLYKHGGGLNFLENLLMAPNMGVFLRRLFYLEVLGNKDSQLVESLQITQSRADDIRDQLTATQAAQKRVLEGLKEKKGELTAQFKGAQSAAKVKKFGSFESFTLALTPSAFTNSWGARRSGGRRHKGTDIMAPCGAPVFAVTDGTVTDMHSGGNGGIMLYMRGQNGDVFFYAHLRKYAPGIQPGSVVRTGQLIAYNGNTGNARGGPCHVHFEWHPRGGRATNPYPLLAAVR